MLYTYYQQNKKSYSDKNKNKNLTYELGRRTALVWS